MTQQDHLRALGYREHSPGAWSHVHYLDGWPTVYATGDRWHAGARTYASVLDAIAMALPPDDLRQALIHRLRGCCDG